MMTKVYRIGTAPAGSRYIGRGGPFGNPFIVGIHGTRSEVIELYRDYLRRSPRLRKKIIQELTGVPGLVCFCAPLPCHGDVILEVLNEHK